MNKCVSERRGNKFFLLGKDEEGTCYWLAEPSWDCGWYWGAGYVETFERNKMPYEARDVDSHQHFDGLFLKKNRNGKIYMDAWKDFFVESPLTNKEVWQLLEYMKSIYTLKETAELFHRGGSNLSSSDEELKSPESAKVLNENVLPSLFKKVEKLLTENS